MKKYIVLGGALILAPSIALAAGDGLAGVLDVISDLIKLAVPIVISLAVLYFLWGLSTYLLKQEKEEGKNMMIWGIIALFVMVSIWGLVNLLSDTFNLDTNINIENPVNVIN